MSARVLRTVVLASLVSGLACTDRPDSAPTEPQFAPAVACDFKAIRTDVRDYFVVADEKKVLAIVDQMETACKNNQPAAQTDFGFEVAANLERVRNAKIQEPKTGTPLVAATLLSDLFKQMPSVQVPAGTNFLPAVQDGGALGVRGGPRDANQTAVVSLGFDPIWGIEPPSAVTPPSTTPAYTSDFGTMSNNVRFLIFGSGAPTFTTLTSLHTSYGLHTIPTVSFNPQAVVFTCVPTDDATGKNRIQHKKTPNADPSASPVLALRVPLYCGTLTAMLKDQEPRTFAGRLLRLFSPEPLHAAAVALTKGGGGGISTLSDFELVQGVTLQHTFDTQPADAFAFQTITVVLKVVAVGTGNTQVPVEGAQLTLTVIGNQGSFTVNPQLPTGTTGDDGKATITFTLDKPGGYTISSGATLGGYQIASATSLMFHIKQ
jgi:hypothetical protein